MYQPVLFDMEVGNPNKKNLIQQKVQGEAYLKHVKLNNKHIK
jgi:hypothetical protein